MNGIYPHGSYEGRLLLEGNEITPACTMDAMKEGIGYVPQEPVSYIQANCVIGQYAGKSFCNIVSLQYISFLPGGAGRLL